MSMVFNQNGSDFDDEDDEQGGTGLGQSGGAGNSQTDVSLGGAGGVVASGGTAPSGSPSQTQGQKPSSSGSWTNLQKYLDANKSQAEGLGDQVAGSITGSAKQAKDTIGNASNDFMGQVKSNTVNFNQDSINKAIADAVGAKAGTKFDPNELSDFQKSANASYSGPTDFTKQAGYGEAQKGISSAMDKYNQSKSEAGRMTLLDDQFKGSSNNGYNQGEKKLDQMLLENNPNNREKFKNIQDEFSGLNSELANATAQNNSAAQSAIQNNQNASSAAKAALANATSGFQNSLNSNLTKAQNDYKEKNDHILYDLKGNTLNNEEMGYLNLAPKTHVYDLSPEQLASYVTPGASPTLYNTANADQYAQAQALAELAGQGGASILPSQYSSQAGTAGSPYSFNYKQFKNDLDSSKANLVNQMLQNGILQNDGQYGVKNNTTDQALDYARDVLGNGIRLNGTGGSTPQSYEMWQNLLNTLNKTIGNNPGDNVTGDMGAKNFSRIRR